MSKKILTLIISPMLFITACKSYPSTAGSTVTPIPKSTVILVNQLATNPSITPSRIPTPTSLPTATLLVLPSPQFTNTKEITSDELSSPPYLVYTKKVNEKEQVVLVNQDGTGKKVISLPDNGFYAKNLSPNGEWLVFYTGSGGYDTVLNGPQYDLALNLMHLPDGKIYEITKLLSKDFPNDLERVAKAAKEFDLDLQSLSIDALVPEIQYTMSNSLLLSAWSPSGEVLAFSGEMYGPSSDLYIYTLESKEIKHLSSGPSNIGAITWFPNGEQIFYSGYYVRCMGDCSTYYVTNLDGSKSKKIENFDTFGGATIFDGWANNSSILLHTTANGPGTCCLRNIDLENEKISMLYSDSFQSYAYDPKTNLLALSTTGTYFSVTDIQLGTYLVDSSHGMQKVADEVSLVYYLGWPDYPFVITGNGTKLLSPSGEIKDLVAQDLVPTASRNNQYVTLHDIEWGDTANGLKIFDNRGNLVLDINRQKITKVTWRIDSLGLFYVSNNQLFYIGIQDLEPILIDDHLSDNDFDTIYMTFEWVR